MDVSPDPLGGHYTDDVSDVTLVNWPQVDYWLTPLIGVPEQERRSSLERRGSCHSALCTGCRQRHRALTAEPAIRASAVPGSAGYPRRSGGGVRSGKPPDRRWAHRVETHVGVDARPGADRAEAFSDTIGVGSYRMTYIERPGVVS